MDGSLLLVVVRVVSVGISCVPTGMVVIVVGNSLSSLVVSP